MLHDNIKAIQLTILTFSLIHTSGIASFLSLPLLIAASFLINSYFYPTTFIALTILSISLATNFTWIGILFMIKYGVLCYGLRKTDFVSEKKGIRSLFFICLALASMHQNQLM